MALQPANQRRYEQALGEADNLYAQREVRAEAASRAQLAYKEALRFRADGGFDQPLIQRRYLDLTDAVADQIIQRYNDAYGKLASDRPESALKAFDDLVDFYPDHAMGQQSLQRHIQKMRELARQRAD